MNRNLTIGVDPRLMFVAVLLIVYVMTDALLGGLLIAAIATGLAWLMTGLMR